jgi:IS30 family transposase
MARPRKIVDPVKVEQMAAIGCTTKEIALLLDVSHSTIERRFVVPYRKGTSKLCHALKKALFREALKGNSHALIFAAKVYCGLKEPVDPQTVVNVSQTAISVTDETKKRLAEMHALLRREALLETQGNGNGEHG